MGARLGALVAAVLLVGAACGGDGQPSEEVEAPFGAPPAGALELSAAETAVALRDPDRVESGIWSLLKQLGIGIYTGQGKKVLAGSERAEDDLWIYDFEGPLLARMARAPARPFSVFHDLLRRLGLRVPAAQVLRLYRATYREHRDAFLPSVLAEMGVTFEGRVDLTPLQEWLLFLDALVPPNARRAATALGLPIAVQEPRCQGPISGPALSGWGYVYGAANWAEVVGAEQAYRTINALLLAQGLRVSLSASPTTVHEGHDGPGGRISLTARVTADYVPSPVPVTCGVLSGTALPLRGPLPQALVTLEVPGALEEHGDLTTGGAPYVGQPLPTDDGGEARVVFQAQEERSRGEGEQRSATGVVRAVLDAKPALLAKQIDPILAAAVPPLFANAVASVDWHSQEEEWAGTLTWTIQGHPTIDLRFAGNVRLTVDDEDSITGTMRGRGTATYPQAGRTDPFTWTCEIGGRRQPQALALDLHSCRTVPSTATPRGSIIARITDTTASWSVRQPYTRLAMQLRCEAC